LLLAEVEGDLYGAASAGLGGVAEGLFVLRQWIGSSNQAVQACRFDEFGGQGESVSPGAVSEFFGAIGVRADHFGLTMPQRCEVNFDDAWHAADDNAASGAGNGHGIFK